jgi:phytanoyl-CoA hydroxylase
MPDLTQSDVKQFREQGYLVVEDILDLEVDIKPVVDEYVALLDNLCERWHREGKLPSSLAGLPFGERLSRVLNAGGDYFRHFDIALPQSQVTDETPIHVGPAVFNLLTSPRLLDAVESLIGPEIYSNPIQHVRIKPPERFVPENQRGNALIATTDWHQDQGVALPEADESTILTVWLPITDATVENGCLCVVPRSHREDLVPHCVVTSSKQGLHIPDQFLRQGDVVPAPIKRGGALFMHRRTMHASLPNTSDDIRWSFDLRYNPIGQPTGRPAFPGFVARSRANPDGVLADAEAWAALWHNTRAQLARKEKPTFNRWREGSPVCA